jgi:hypothetical protein
LEIEAHVLAFLALMFVLSSVAGKGKRFHGLCDSLYIVPLMLVGQVPLVVSMLVGWEGGWLLGALGAAVGAAAGAAAGWLYGRWSLPDSMNPPSKRWRAIALPTVFALLLAFYGAHNWAVEWLTPDHAWVIVIVLVALSLPGALVGRPILGMLVMSPLSLLLMVPLVASLTVGWEGGLVPGIAGATLGAAAGALQGWLFNRWIMPEYDARRQKLEAASQKSEVKASESQSE